MQSFRNLTALYSPWDHSNVLLNWGKRMTIITTESCWITGTTWHFGLSVTVNASRGPRFSALSWWIDVCEMAFRAPLNITVSSHQAFKRLLRKMSRCTSALTWRRWSKMGHVTWSGGCSGAKNPGRGGETEEQKREASIRTFTAFLSI